MAETTTNDKGAIIQMFTDATPGESYNKKRLVTRENEVGNVEIIAYGWAKLAEYNERRDIITLFRGHERIRSCVMTRHLNDIEEVARERGRKVIEVAGSPVINKPNDGVQYVGNYVNFTPNHSSVERDAIKTVVDSIDKLI